MNARVRHVLAPIAACGLVLLLFVFGAWSNRVGDGAAEAERKSAEFATQTTAQVKRELEQLSGQPRMVGVTMQAYAMLKPGMTNMDAWAIIGSECVEQSSVGNVVTKCWQEDGKAIVVTFQDGRLVAKSQVGW